MAAELKGKGVEFTKDVTQARPGVRICFIRGPQGISIEILERKPVASAVSSALILGAPKRPSLVCARGFETQ